MVDSGFFGIGETLDTIEYGTTTDIIIRAIMLLAMYLALALFLLRKKKESEYIESK